MAEQYAFIDYTEEENSQERLQVCVYAECSEKGCTAGPVWGHSRGSVLRVLSELTKVCTCGATFHIEEPS